MQLRSKAAALIAASLICLPAIASARTQIRAVGSSTVYPFATAVAERLARANPGMQPPVIESTGTGGGMKLFCAGVGENFPDIENASRRIKASEVKLCAQNGVSQITEIQVGIDGIAFAEAASAPLGVLTQRDIYMALAKTPFGKPNKAKTWKDVNPKLPAIPIKVYGPPPTSGTRDAFGELIMTPPCEANAAMAALKKSDEAKFKAICTGLREDGGYVEAGENDNLIVQKVATDPGTLGVLGYSYLADNADKVRPVQIGGVTPTEETIANLSYPGARKLYVYIKGEHLAAKPKLRDFVTQYSKMWSKDGPLERVGLVPFAGADADSAAKQANDLKPLDPSTLK